MTTPRADVALVTERRFAASIAAEGDWYLDNILRDDALLQSALLKDHGLSARRVDWTRRDVDWSMFRCVVIRTTWDYVERVAAFRGWIERVSGQARLCNAPEIVSWNLDKHYLADLAAGGVPVVPSHFIERGSTVSLREVLDATGWDDAVLKPCVSAGARHTYRLNRRTADELQPGARRLLAAESLILQPFQSDVIRRGEDTLMVINGQFTHAVRKTPKGGDFRVQDDYGGAVAPCQPAQAQIDLAERAIAASPLPPAYGRVDMVRGEDGQLAVMELELIEPELWLRFCPHAATVMAEAVAAIAMA